MLKSVLSIGLAWLAITCSGRSHAPPEPLNTIDRETSVLIVTRPSDFKQRVVRKLIDSYRTRTLITLVDLDDIDDIRTNGYDAMVVMGARRGFLLLSSQERRFLRRLEDPERLILVMTAAMNDWTWDRHDVDVITCASEPGNIEPLYQKVSARLDSLLVD